MYLLKPKLHHRMENIIILFCIYFISQGGFCTSQAEWGVVRFNTGPSDVQGSLLLYQSAPENPTIVYGWVYNLKANSKHGFHVHETGDFSNACISTGPHYNPRNFTHGSRSDDIRHAGDLSNIETNSRGIAVIYLKDEKIQLSGPESIMGRAFVIHELEDDEGRGDNEESKRTGNAGARIKCGIVGKYILRQ